MGILDNFMQDPAVLMGIGLLAGNRGQSRGEALGNALQGGLQTYGWGQQLQTNQALAAMRAMEMQQRMAQQQRIQGLLAGLPEDERAMATLSPEGWAKAKLGQQYPEIPAEVRTLQALQGYPGLLQTAIELRRAGAPGGISIGSIGGDGIRPVTEPGKAWAEREALRKALSPEDFAAYEAEVKRAQTKPLPTEAFDSFTQTVDAFKALDMMEKGVSESGKVMGWLSRGQSALGFNPKAIEFETGWKNYRLAAQALIKGTPSNFDVQSVVETVPSLTDAPEVNQSKLAYAKDALGRLLEARISQYKGLGFQIPESFIKAAKERGIDVSAIKAWDGKSDPFRYKEGDVMDLGGTKWKVKGLYSDGSPDIERIQ